MTKKTLILLLLCIFLFRFFLFEPFRIPSGSMIPTLMIGDFILASKRPFTLRSFERGDVIVFRYPKDKTLNYVKRIIGIPGDRLKIQKSRVIVNGTEEELREITPLKELDTIKNDYNEYSLKFFRTKTGNREHVIQKNNFQDDHKEILIPTGHYFVMGDNRDFSYDSRFWGLLKEEDIRGKALFVWFSLAFPSEAGTWNVRPKRIGRSIR